MHLNRAPVAVGEKPSPWPRCVTCHARDTLAAGPGRVPSTDGDLLRLLMSRPGRIGPKLPIIHVGRLFIAGALASLRRRSAGNATMIPAAKVRMARPLPPSATTSATATADKARPRPQTIRTDYLGRRVTPMGTTIKSAQGHRVRPESGQTLVVICHRQPLPSKGVRGRRCIGHLASFSPAMTNFARRTVEAAECGLRHEGTYKRERAMEKASCDPMFRRRTEGLVIRQWGVSIVPPVQQRRKPVEGAGSLQRFGSAAVLCTRERQ